MMLVSVDGERSEREQRVFVRSLERFGENRSHFDLLRPGEPGRVELEHFIYERFEAIHGARVTSFMPLLLGMWSGSACRAALGIRRASEGRLFLEDYLDQPAEQVIAGIRHMPVLRTTLVEIGNLVSGPGASTPLLYLLLLAVLARAGYRWLMFVATPEVQRGIRAAGLEIDAVCPADPGRIANVAAWGSYYAVHPQVMLGCVEDGMRHCTADAHLADALIRADASIATLASRLGAP